MPAIDSKTRVAVGALVYFLGALVLSAYSARNPAIVSAGAALIGEGLRPFRAVTNWVSVGVSGFWNSYVALVGVEAERADLLERVRTLEAENSRLVEVQGENERLRRLLGIAELAQLEGVAARVVGRDATNWVKTVTIDRGRSSGLAPGMAVVSGDGVVGQVVSASPSTALVLLITDHSSGIDAIVQGNRARGIVEGTGESACRWRFVRGDAEVAIGDRLITSGLDGIFPKGLLLGVVTDLGDVEGLFRSIVVTPAARLSAIEDVFVVTTVQSFEPPPPVSIGGKVKND
jgi:rod shape-determining protein MreC